MSDYVVRRSSPAMVLGPLVSVALIAVWVGVFTPPRPIIVFAGLGAIVAGALRARAVGTRLRVDSRGITLGAGARQPSAYIPWASVREVVIVTGDAGPRVGVRLHSGAPLPDGLRAIVQDPANRDRVPPGLVRTVTGLDPDALGAALRDHDIHLASANEM